MLHELWVDADGLDTFVLSGAPGEGARQLMAQPARLVWTVEAPNHFAAMTAYYRFRGLGEYTTVYPELDGRSYHDDGLE